MKRPAARKPLGSPEARIGAVVALVVLIGLVVWLLARGDDDSTPASAGVAKAVSAEDLAALPESVGHPVYWAGPKRGFTYELTQTRFAHLIIRGAQIPVKNRAAWPHSLIRPPARQIGRRSSFDP